VEEHVLGIITQFAHAVNDFQVRQPLAEKKRYILAIGEMIKIARGHVSSALPQVSLCVYVDHLSASWTLMNSDLCLFEIGP